MNTPQAPHSDGLFDTGLMWFRRDLRTRDNATLHQALNRCRQVHCVFVLDTDILDPLPRVDRRVEFIRESLVELDDALAALGGRPGCGLIVRHARAQDEIARLAQALGVQAVFAGRDDEPQALQRDAAVDSALRSQGARFITCKDHVIFERRELLTQSGRVYGVFTPYKRAWLERLAPQHLADHDVNGLGQRLAPRPPAWCTAVPELGDFGFAPSNLRQLKLPTGMSGADRLFQDFAGRMDRYHVTRDHPAVKGPSYLSVHLRFGTASVRRLAAAAWQRQRAGCPGAATWLGELIWRDFYVAILANHPQVVQQAFKPEYDAIVWETGPQAQALYAAWCEGHTGYPLVDAAMAQLNQTGYMHNRLRMVTGSFLVKDLGLDWRWGERYFALHLNDFDLSANNGGWQWVASSGCDAQPYFRIFNPVSQSEKFDPQGKFIRRYLPQLSGLSDQSIHAPWRARDVDLQSAGIRLGHTYPAPVVQHDQARARTLERYAVVKKEK